MKEHEFNNPLLLQDALVMELEKQGKIRVDNYDEWEVVGCRLSFEEGEIEAHNKRNAVNKLKGLKTETLMEMITNKFIKSTIKYLFSKNREYDVEIRAFNGVVEDKVLRVNAIIAYK